MPDNPAPLAPTYRRIGRLCSALAVDLTDITGENPAPAGRLVRAAELRRRPDAVAALVEGESERVRRTHGRAPRPHVAASRVLHHYLWSAGLLFAGPWFLEYRVPDIPPDALRVAPDTARLALDVTRVTAEPGGPERVRARLAAHLAPVLAAFGPYLRRGPRALWGMAADDLVSGVWQLGRALGDEERGVREATALLPGGTPPFPGAADFRLLRATPERSHHTRTRIGCCLYYAIAPDGPCLTCPRLPDAERLRRLPG